MSCDICVLNYNKTVNRQITCSKCQYSACMACYKQVIESSITEAKCISCNNIFAYEFIATNFPQTYVNKEYRMHLAKITQDSERLKMHEAVPYLQLAKDIDNISNRMCAVNITINKLKSELAPLEGEYYRLSRDKSRLQYQYDRKQLTNNATTDDIKDDILYVMNCIRADCNGYITKSYKCTTCDIRVCAQCHKLREGNGDNHICDPIEVESVAAIKKDTRQCPKCFTPIHRISGCNQMWCTVCHTTFNYNTGKIEVGITHNPHYYEYLRANNREEDAVHHIQCGEMPTYRQLEGLLIRKNAPRSEISSNILQFLQFSIEINDMLLRHNRYYMHYGTHNASISFNNLDETDYNNKLLEYRVEYLKNSITQEQWLSRINSCTNLHRRDREYHQLYTTMYNISRDLYIKFTQDYGLESEKSKCASILADMNTQIVNLIEFINTTVDKMCKILNTNMRIKIYQIEHRGKFYYMLKRGESN